jgi:hypothetical protein
MEYIINTVNKLNELEIKLIFLRTSRILKVRNEVIWKKLE